MKARESGVVNPARVACILFIHTHMCVYTIIYIEFLVDISMEDYMYSEYT